MLAGAPPSHMHPQASRCSPLRRRKPSVIQQARDGAFAIALREECDTSRTMAAASSSMIGVLLVFIKGKDADRVW